MALVIFFWRLDSLDYWRLLFVKSLIGFVDSFENFGMIALVRFMFFGVDLGLIGGFFGRKCSFKLSRCSGSAFFLGFVGFFMLIDMDIKIVHNLFKLFVYFDIFVIGSRVASFRLDKDNWFNGVFFDWLISLSIKELKLFVSFFR